MTLSTEDYEYILLEDGTAKIVLYKGLENRLLIPDSLEGHKVSGIGDEAFSLCDYLISVRIPDSVGDLGVNPFSACVLLSDIKVSPDHPALTSDGGVLFGRADKRLICYPCGLTAKTYSIPRGTRIIGNEAFFYCKRLTDVTIPDSVTEIGDYAFSFCHNLTDMTIPDSVTRIGFSAFWGCKNLKTVTIPDSVVSIGDDAFDRFSLKNVDVRPDSYARQYCAENSIPHSFAEA